MSASRPRQLAERAERADGLPRVAILTDETGWHTTRLRRALARRGFDGRLADEARPLVARTSDEGEHAPHRPGKPCEAHEPARAPRPSGPPSSHASTATMSCAPKELMWLVATVRPCSSRMVIVPEGVARAAAVASVVVKVMSLPKATAGT